MRRFARLAKKEKAKLEKEAQKNAKENQLSDQISKIALDNDTTAEPETMRRFDRLKEKKAKPQKEVQMDRRAKKKRISKIAALDNGTMVEAFKHLNYCQLAINGLVSKRFRDLIQTHRPSLARLYVNSIAMNPFPLPAATKIFEKALSPKAYNEWVIGNGYSKQAPLDDQIASTQGTKNIWCLCANATYLDYRDRVDNACDNWDDETRVFSAHAELTHENWPLFQHFVRLATDPFVYLVHVSLAYQNDVFNLLAGALNPDHSRVQCKTMRINLRGNIQNSLTWAKNYVRCSVFYIDREAGPNRDEAFADFLLTGENCTSSISVDYQFDVSQAMVNFVKKFMDLKNYDGCHIVETINSRTEFYEAAEVMKRNFSDFVVKEEKEIYWTTRTFEFVNDNIGKKLQHTTKFYSKGHGYFRFSLC